MRGTNWYGRGVTEIRPNERNGVAPDRRLRRAALNRVITPVASPGRSGLGRGKLGRRDLVTFERKEDSNLVGKRRRQWPKPNNTGFLIGQNDPVASASANQ